MIVLSAYTLSGGYRRDLESAVGEPPTYLTLPELRRLPLPGIVRALRSGRGGRCLLAIEDPSSYGVLPVLETLASVSGARRLDVAHPDLRLERISRARAAVTLAPLAGASAGGVFAVRRARGELAALRTEQRIDVAFGSAPERLLYVNPNLWFGLKAGGSVGHVAGVVNALSRRDIAVTLASASDPVLVDEDVRFVRIEPPAPFALPFAVNGYRLQHRLLDRLANVAVDADLVYQRNAMNSYIGVQLSRSRRVPLVLEYNGSEVWAAEHWGRGVRYADVAREAEEASLRHAHLVVTVSDVLADELRDRGVPDERIVCYPNCVDASVFDSVALSGAAAVAREQLGIPVEAVVVGFVGTFGRWHGAERFAAAIAQLQREAPASLEERGVRFLFVGDGTTMSEVRTNLAGAEHLVTFAGLVPQDKSPALLAACDVLVSPHVPNADGSRFFGSPTKLFEYMAVGKGIVASDLDQIGEVLSGSLRTGALPAASPEGSTAPAVLTRPGSVDDLAEGIRFLCDHPAWRATLGANARERVLARYTWSHHVDAIMRGLLGSD